jgi:hypothetical protein
MLYGLVLLIEIEYAGALESLVISILYIIIP